MSDIETTANTVLREAAARQAVVDRLLGRSVWNGFVTSMLAPVSANLLFLIAGAGGIATVPITRRSFSPVRS